MPLARPGLTEAAIMSSTRVPMLSVTRIIVTVHTRQFRL